MNRVLLLLLSLSVSSCGLFATKELELKAHPNNTAVKQKLPAFVKIDLSGEGYIEMKQKFKSYGFCEAMKPDMKVIITPFKKYNEYKTKIWCDKRSKTFFLKSKNILPTGSYKVELDFDHDNSSMVGHPLVGVSYKDPDFNSEDDHIKDGAKPWAADQKIAGILNPGDGDATDWLKLDGIGGNIQITLLDKSKDKNLIAHVYWVDPEKDKVVKKKWLKSQRRMTIPSPDEKEVYLRIVGKKLIPPTKYTLFRKDKGKVSVTSLKVVDFIQVGQTTWNALLKAKEGIEVGSEIRIKGQKSSGKYVTLGKCKVTSVDASFISCSIKVRGNANYSNYTGQFISKP